MMAFLYEEKPLVALVDGLVVRFADLPTCGFTRLLIGIFTDLPAVFGVVAMAVLYPIVIKLRKKMNVLMRKLY